MIEKFKTNTINDLVLKFTVHSNNTQKITDKMDRFTLVSLQVNDNDNKIIFDVNILKDKMYLDLTLKAFIERTIEEIENKHMKKTKAII